MRGNLRYLSYFRWYRGSIPAHAGEPPILGLSPLLVGVYPRACGGTYLVRMIDVSGEGLSPRMRGNHGEVVGPSTHLGSIPAHAGEPRPPQVRYGPPWVYPRACGGTSPATCATYVAAGLSPRMRGNHLGLDLVVLPQGSIPAHAGEPYPVSIANDVPRVYPRACGGTISFIALSLLNGGLSPRMRGNRHFLVFSLISDGSIPAHAGEPL